MNLTTFSVDDFISSAVTGRRSSLFGDDLATHESQLRAGIEGKSVLVIGGAGTIGSSFIRAPLFTRPPGPPGRRRRRENGLTELTRDLRSAAGQYVPADFLTYPISFGDAVFERMLTAEGPFDIVAHFAAHKHVRSEDRYSIEAMLENNVLSTARLLDLLLDSPPEHFFCVSTDKAANPANVMGASKKLMEEAVLAYAAEVPGNDRAFRERGVLERFTARGVSRAIGEAPAAGCSERCAALLRVARGERTALPAGLYHGRTGRHLLPAAGAAANDDLQFDR